MAHIHTHSYKIIFISLFCLLRSAISLSPYPKVENNLPALGNWLSHGGDIYNRRYAEGESKISPWTASRLRLKWRFNAGNDITATPAVCDGIVYFPSWNGYIYAVRAADGSLVWRKTLQHLTALNSILFTSNSTAPVARATPAVADDKLIIGISGPSYVIAVKRATGDLVWKTQLEDHYASLITMSGTYYNRAFYVGVSSLEELSSTVENCCTFRGSFVKLDTRTGAILWRTFMLPDNHGSTGGYAGAALWGSCPSIDQRRNHVYIATGNLYSVPQSVEECQEKQDNQTTPTHPEQCIGPEIHYGPLACQRIGIVGKFMIALSRRRYCCGSDREVLRSPSPSPWMMLAPSFNKFKEQTSTTVYNFYDPVEGRVVNLNSKGGKQEQVHGRHMELVGSSHGWLAWFNRENKNMFLLNPLSGHRIDLPVPPQRPMKVILSCSPYEEECYALVMLFFVNRVAFCRPGRSTTWSNRRPTPEQNIIDGELKLYSDFVYSPAHGSFLGIARYKYLHGVFLEYWKVDDKPRMVRSSLLGRWDMNTDWDKFELTNLVSCMDRLFVVRRNMKGEIYVYRAYCDAGGLELCSSLDDLAMFVGYYNSLAVQASDQFPKLMSNFIYTISGRYNYFRSRYDRTCKYTSEDYKDRWNRMWFTPSFD